MFSQENQREFPYVISYQDNEKGLPQNQILDIIEDTDGLIISTFNGIVKYDGSQFSSFIPNRDYLKKSYHRIFLDKETKNIYGWTTYDGGYNQLSPVFKKITLYRSMTKNNDTLTGITEDGRIEIIDFQRKNIYQTLETNIKDATAIFRQGQICYVSDNFNLYEVNMTTSQQTLLSEGKFYVIKKNPFNNQIIAVNSDRWFLNITTKEKKDIAKDIKEGVDFSDILFLAADEILISSSAGLFHIKNNKIEIYGKEYNPNFTSLTEFFHVNSEDCILVGTQNKGLLSFFPKKATTYFASDEMGVQSFSSVVEDKDGTVIGTSVRGSIIEVKNGVSKKYLSPQKHISSMAYINNKLYFSTWGSIIYIYDKKRLVDSLVAKDLFSAFQKSIFQDSSGDIWFGTNKGVVKKTKNEDSKIVLNTDIDIMTTYELKNGNLCFGGGSSVFILNKEGTLLKTINEKDGLFCREVRSFYEDDTGRLWIGTYGGGLYVLDNDNLTSINKTSNCRLQQDVFTLAKYKDKLFMSSNKGIWAIREDKLFDFYEGKIPFLIPTYYGKESGIMNTEFNGGFQNNFLIKENKLYFPSIEGLVELTIKEKSKTENRKLTPYIRSVTINDTLLINNTLLDSSSAFERSTHTIKFDFYCVSFSEQYNIHYQHKILGPNLPDKWSEPQKQNFVTLKMLPPGEYKFLVRAIDSENDLNPTILSYEFEIKPYFYETNIFTLLLTLLLAIIILMLIRLQTKSFNRKNKINNTILELKLNSIQSKMDPHFIFNSINNIVYLLSIKKSNEAEELLQDFSLLLRQYTERNDDILTPLSIELEMIELYLSIQQKRFNCKFEYIIDCPKELKSFKIPAFIIQPFVENSILHGLAHNDKVKGILSIIIRHSNNTFEIKIKDNGIGRKKSSKINRNRSHHNSVGMQLIRERFHILEKKYSIKTELEIIDIDENDKTGTIVILKIIDNDKMLNS